LTTSREQRIGCPVEAQIRRTVDTETVSDSDTDTRASVEARIAGSVDTGVSSVGLFANSTDRIASVVFSAESSACEGCAVPGRT
jgi:hypothetical protein